MWTWRAISRRRILPHKDWDRPSRRREPLGGQAMTERSKLRITCRVAICVLLMFTLLAGCCYTPRWILQQSVTPERVAQALDDPGGLPRDLKPEEVPQIPVRIHLRPCCSFGTHLQARLWGQWGQTRLLKVDRGRKGLFVRPRRSKREGGFTFSFDFGEIKRVDFPPESARSSRESGWVPLPKWPRRFWIIPYPGVGGRCVAASRSVPFVRSRSLAGHGCQLKEESPSSRLAWRYRSVAAFSFLLGSGGLSS